MFRLSANSYECIPNTWALLHIAIKGERKRQSEKAQLENAKVTWVESVAPSTLKITMVVPSPASYRKFPPEFQSSGKAERHKN